MDSHIWNLRIDIHYFHSGNPKTQVVRLPVAKFIKIVQPHLRRAYGAQFLQFKIENRLFFYSRLFSSKPRAHPRTQDIKET